MTTSPPDLPIRDDGRYALTLADDAPSFESRRFAMAVAEQQRLRSTKHDPQWCRR
jgi:hypothetical protein